MNTDELMTLPKGAIPEASKTLSAGDIKFLVRMLSEKDEKLRYNAFLLLQSSSQNSPQVYQYWNEIEDKLSSDNSYQRSLSIILISENVRWDKEDRFAKTIGKYLSCCKGEKFINSRQTIQGLATITKATDKYDDQIKQELANVPIAQYKASQQKLLVKDISFILKTIKSKATNTEKTIR